MSAAKTKHTEGAPASAAKVRLDRWLWAARFFKTRAQAKGAIEGGKISIDGNKPKASKEITAGVVITIQKGQFEYEVGVDGLSDRRGSAPEAQRLYTETPQSIEAREQRRAEQRMQRAGLRIPQKRPDKHERRAIKALKQRQHPGSGSANQSENPDA